MSNAALQPASASALPERDFSAHVFPVLVEGAGARRSRDEDRLRIERQWQARGHTAGYAEGLRAAAGAAAAEAVRQAADHAALLHSAQAEHEHALMVLQAAARALDTRTMPVVSDAEDSLLETALHLAEAIVGHALADEAAAARFALGRIGAAGGVTGSRPVTPVAGTHTVRLHPQDLAVLGSTHIGAGLGADLSSGLRADGAGVVFVADATLARGDAVSEFPHGFIDARIGSAFARVRAALERPAT